MSVPNYVLNAIEAYNTHENNQQQKEQQERKAREEAEAKLQAEADEACWKAVAQVLNDGNLDQQIWLKREPSWGMRQELERTGFTLTEITRHYDSSGGPGCYAAHDAKLMQFSCKVSKRGEPNYYY